MEKKRLSYMDLLKFIAMFYVIFAHVVQRVIPAGTTKLAFGIFYSVHMSIFMFVGGYFIRRCVKLKELFKYYLKMFVLYIFPAIVFTLLTVLTMERYQSHDVFYWFKEYLLRTDSFYWYGIAAFIINALIAFSYYLVNKVFKEDELKCDIFKNIGFIVVFLIMFSPIAFIYNTPNKPLLAINLIVEFVPLAIIGFLFKNFGKYFNDNNINKYLEIGISVICLAIYTLLLNKYPGWYGIDSAKSLVLHQLGAICGVYVYYVIAKYLCKIKLFGDVSVYGKYSYEIYLVHVYLIRIITPYVSKVSEINFYSISFVVIYALTFALGSLGVTILLTKNKYINLALFGNYKPLLIKKDTKSLN